MYWPFFPRFKSLELDFVQWVIVFLCFYGIYQAIVSFRGFWPAKPLPPASSLRRFAILVPAHNEEKVIGSLLDSLNKQSYPREFFDVYVACDACNDATPEIAKEYGGIALLRNDPLHPGKTQNIRWALNNIPLDEYEAVVIFDADNLANPHFLSQMNDYLEAHPGAEAVQGYLDTKNFSDSWLTRVYALAYWYTNRFWQLARANWGLSATLGGTGLVITVSCIKRLGWDLQSLTEDLEFSAKLVLSGGKVHWNEWAITYDEKPLSYLASHRQRLRWMQGHYWVGWHYGPKLLAKFFTTFRFQYLDYFLYLLTPFIVILSFVLTVFEVARWIISSPASGLFFFWYWWIPFALLQSVYQIVIGPSLREGKVTFKYVVYLFYYAWYGITWIPVVFYSLFLSGNQKHWVKTEHVRNLSIEEVVNIPELDDVRKIRGGPFLE